MPRKFGDIPRGLKKVLKYKGFRRRYKLLQMLFLGSHIAKIVSATTIQPLPAVIPSIQDVLYAIERCEPARPAKGASGHYTHILYKRSINALGFCCFGIFTNSSYSNSASCFKKKKPCGNTQKTDK